MKFVYPVYPDATTSAHAGSFTNMYRANDGSIDAAMTGIDNTDDIEFALDTSRTVDSVAIYVTTGTATVNIHKNASPSASLGSGSISAGWNIVTVSAGQASQYWHVVFSSVSSVEVSEIFPAYTFDFPYGYDLGNTDASIFGVDSVDSRGGSNFSNKRHAERFIKDWTWGTFSDTNKTAYKAMITAVDGVRSKFLWYDEDSAYQWVKFIEPPTFNREAYDAHTVSTKIIEQLT